MKVNIKEIAVLILVVALSATALYYYFKVQSAKNYELEPIERREETRSKQADSILEINYKLEDSLNVLNDSIKKIEAYEIPKIDNSDLPNADSRKLDSIITSYYK